MSNASMKLGLAAATLGAMVTATACMSSTAFVGGDGTPADDGGADAALADASPHPDAGDAVAPVSDAAPGFCDGGLAMCGNTCVNFGNDAKNCGGCGVDCGGSHKCMQGTCQTHEVLASNQQGARGIAIDATSIYWTAQTANTVMKMPLGGGSVTTLASSQNEPYAIAVDATSVYWTNAGANTVMRVPIGGGSPSVVVSDPAVYRNLAIDGTSVYFAGGNKIMKALKGGGSATKLADVPSGENLVVSGAWIYVASDPVATIQTVRVPLAGGALAVLGTSTGGAATDIAVDGTSVYWSDGDDASKAPLGGGSTQTLASAFGLWHFAIDATSLYWTDGVAVKKKPIGGGAESTLTNCLPDCPIAFAVDATHLYWTSYNASSIVRVLK